MNITTFSSYLVLSIWTLGHNLVIKADKQYTSQNYDRRIMNERK